MQDLNEFLEPGMLVKHPSETDWGVGQVQSRVNGKVTVNFTEVGKIDPRVTKSYASCMVRIFSCILIIFNMFFCIFCMN